MPRTKSWGVEWGLVVWYIRNTFGNSFAFGVRAELGTLF